MAKSKFPVQNFIYKYFPWTSIFYAKRRHPEHSLLSLIKMWVAATPPENRERHSLTEMLYGNEKITRAEQFFYLLALRNYEIKGGER